MKQYSKSRLVFVVCGLAVAIAACDSTGTTGSGSVESQGLSIVADFLRQVLAAALL